MTRLHVRYTAAQFPEDLVFQETNDRQNFQGRYIIRHPWQGDPKSMPGSPDLPGRAGQTPGKGSPEPREPHRLENRRHPPRHPAPATTAPEAPKKEPAWWENIWGGK